MGRVTEGLCAKDRLYLSLRVLQGGGLDPSKPELSRLRNQFTHTGRNSFGDALVEDRNHLDPRLVDTVSARLYGDEEEAQELLVDIGSNHRDRSASLRRADHFSMRSDLARQLNGLISSVRDLSEIECHIGESRSTAKVQELVNSCATSVHMRPTTAIQPQ